MGKRILAVDDSVMMLEVYFHVLVAEGYSVSAATGGGQALRQLEDDMGVPDLILLDIGLPDMSGWEFLRVIRQRVEWRAIPVLVVSAFVEPSVAEGATYPEYQRYLSKMETARELVPLVREIIGIPAVDEAAPPTSAIRDDEADEDEVWPLAA